MLWLLAAKKKNQLLHQHLRLKHLLLHQHPHLLKHQHLHLLLTLLPQLLTQLLQPLLLLPAPLRSNFYSMHYRPPQGGFFLSD